MRGYLRLFSTPRDAFVFWKLARGGYRGQGPRTVRLRALGGSAVECRPGTTDADTVWSTFCGLYHLPFVPVRSGGSILDLGANIGLTTADLKTRYPTARVVAVEMDEDNVAAARRNLSRLGLNCELIHAAVWTWDGEVAYGGPAEDAFSVAGASGTAPASRTAPAVTLETLFDRLRLDRVDFVKMDVEGAERQLLQRPAQWLSRVGAMHVEVHAPDNVEAVAAFLRSAGFESSRDERHWSAVRAWRSGAATCRA